MEDGQNILKPATPLNASANW